MNEMTAAPSQQTMTSREIAELTEKRHDHVLRDIDVLLKTISPDLGYGFKSSTYLSGEPPREYRQFELDRDSSYCLIAGYDPNARMRIIKRWQELEAVNKLTGARLLIQQGYAMLALEQEQERVAKELVTIKEDVKTSLDTSQSVKKALDVLKAGRVFLTTQELAKRRKCSVATLNNLLEAAGLQKWFPSKTGANRFDLTTKGARYGEKRMIDGVRFELFWSPETVKYIEENA